VNVIHTAKLPSGVSVRPLDTHPDARGRLTEIFRQEWQTGVDPLQWNLLHSHATVMRGMNVHLKHDDYYVLASGRLTLGLYDLRRSSPTYGMSTMMELSSDRLAAVVVPIGVLHGTLYHASSVMLTGRSNYFDPDDDLGCLWSDPALGFTWETHDPILVGRDAERPSLSALEAELAHAKALGHS
jgi:dTDP-4-dehydrorhamnose 3,5-epimerase